MTPYGFLKEIIERYHNARLPIHPHAQIFRGESRCISSEVEDLFANYLANKLPENIIVYVNQIITAGSKSSRQRMKPDLVLVKDQSILAIFDLKMDLGYKRGGFIDYWRERNAQIPLLHTQVFSLFEKSGSSKTRKFYRFSENAMLFYIIISDQNISERVFRQILETKSKMEYSDIFVLSSYLHPNAYNMSVEEVLKKIKINTTEFDRLKFQLDQIIQKNENLIPAP
jgi:hypothetical protein